jgi:hypothetical protein
MVTVTTTAFDNIPTNLQIDPATSTFSTASTTPVDCTNHNTVTIPNNGYTCSRICGQKDTGNTYWYWKLTDGTTDYQQINRSNSSSYTYYYVGLSGEWQNTSGSSSDVKIQIWGTGGAVYLVAGSLLLGADSEIWAKALIVTGNSGSTPVIPLKMNITDYYGFATSLYNWSNKQVTSGSTASTALLLTANTSAFHYRFETIIDGNYDVVRPDQSTYAKTSLNDFRMLSTVRNCVTTTGLSALVVGDSTNYPQHLPALVLFLKGTRIDVT